jgi:transcription initiation factor IIE alpha subunit
MSLIRCSPCRYSFEHNVDEDAPTACPQCGEKLTTDEESRLKEVSERQPTQELRLIRKPND